MDFFLKKTNGVIVPAGALDEEKLAKIPDGEPFKGSYVKNRNYGNHARFFAFIKILFDSQDKFKDENVFRRYLQCRAGYGIPVEISGVSMIMPDSITYDRLDEIEFRKLFSRVIDAALLEFPEWVRADMIEIIEKQIIDFI
jgi:hypothetical protein